MADRTNAAIFGALFEALAQHVEQEYSAAWGGEWETDPEDDVASMAMLLFSISKGFDFDSHQMYADSAPALLGLAAPSGDTHTYIDCPRFTKRPDLAGVTLFPPTFRPIRTPLEAVGNVVEFRPLTPLDLEGLDLAQIARELESDPEGDDS